LVAELAEGRSIDEVATAMGLNRTDLAVALWSAANPSSQTHTLTTAGYDQARLDLYQALHSTMGWTALSSLDDTAASILDRIHELEQRLALISELASNPPPHLEVALAQLEAVAAVSQDGDAATQATLKWLPLAHQLGEAQRHQERLEALIRAADDMRSWYDKQMGPEGPEDTYDRLRAGIQLDSKESPSNPLALAWDEGHEAKAKAVREGSTADTSQQNPYR
jgi:hypothetical protein